MQSNKCRVFAFLLVALLRLELTANFLPQVTAVSQIWNVTPQRQWSAGYKATLNDEIVDWTDIDSPTVSWDGATVYNGILWVMDQTKIYYSTDGGSTFTEYANMPDSACFSLSFLNASDKLVAWKSTELWYSTNNGSSWTSGLTPPSGGSFTGWSFAMDELGYIYIGVYGDTTNEKHIIYMSIDYGATWTEVYNQTGRHIHDVAFDSYANRLWVGCGDPFDYGSTPYDTYLIYSDDHGNSWTNFTSMHKPTAITFTENYVIYENDDQGVVYRIDKSTNTLELTFIAELEFSGGYAESIMYDSSNDVVYMQAWQQTPTKYSVWISPDEGLHWYMLHNTTDYIGGITNVDDNGYLYFGKGYRLKALTHEEATQFTFHNWKEGDRPSGESVAIEHALIHGQSYTIPLYQEPLSNVQVKFEGMSFENLLTNPSFENDFSGWTEFYGAGSSGVIDTTHVYDGSKSAKLHRGTQWCYIEQTFNISENHEYLIKGTITTGTNFTTTGAGIIYIIKNSTGGELVYTSAFALNDNWNFTWSERNKIVTSPATSATMTIRCNIGNEEGLEAWYDALSVFDVTGSEEWDYYARALPPVDEGVQNTTNPSVSINGNTVSYVGQLANGSQTSATPLSGDFYESVSVTSVSVNGSKIVTAVITGNRIFETDDMLVKRQQSDLYYALKTYSSPTFTSYDTSKLLVYSDATATLSDLSLTDATLTFTVTDTGTSTTKVYCGNKGKPKTVSGATSWSYDSNTKICTITLTHSSSQEVVLDWTVRITGDVNGDGVVDASDLFDLSKAYGSSLGDVNWNPDCDFNRDDKVDASDLFDLGKNYGKTIIHSGQPVEIMLYRDFYAGLPYWLLGVTIMSISLLLPKLRVQ